MPSNARACLAAALLLFAPQICEARAAKTYQPIFSSTWPGNTGTQYVAPTGQHFTFVGNTEVQNRVRIPVAGTLSRLKVYTGDPPGAAKSWAVTINVDSTPSTLTCTVSGAASTTCSDLIHEVALVADNELSLTIAASGTPTATILGWTMMFSPTVAGQTIMIGGAGDQNLPTSGTTYVPFAGGGYANATEAYNTVVMPTAGTFSNLTARLNVAPNNGGGTQSMAFTVRKGGTNQALTCTISEAATACADTSNSFTVAAGDTVSIAATAAGTPVVTILRAIGLCFTPTVPGEFVIPSTNDTAASVSALRYEGVWAQEANQSDAEIDVITWLPKMTIKAMYASLSVAPANGAGTQSYTYVLRQNEADTGMTITVSEAGTTGNSTTITEIAEGDYCATSITPANTPAATRESISYVGFIPPRRAVALSVD